jgi:transposase-like protein
MRKTNNEKEAIIADYLTGETSYRKSGIKHGVDFRLIHSWVMKYQGKTPPPRKTDSSAKEELNSLPRDVKQLQQELRKAQLHNKLLNAIIDIAEEQLKIDIRKKSGTKQ